MRAAAALILATIVMLAACTPTHERERYDFERMRVQQRYSLYGPSASFANGLSMQQPPPGTVSLEAIAPAPDTRDSARLIARGKDRFGIYCAVCHGPAGFGGSLVALNMGIPRPPSLRTPQLRAQPDSYFFNVASHGKGRMPAYAPQLSVYDRWAVVAYVRSLQSHGAASGERDDSLMAVEIHAIDSAAALEHRK